MKWRYAFLAVLVILAFTSAYFPKEFVYDSASIIKNNPRITGNIPWTTVWTTSYWGVDNPSALYRPLTLSTFRIEYQWLNFKSNPSYYLSVNLILHLLVVFLVFKLSWIWLEQKRASLIAGALVAVHPIATSVVPNLVGRADLLVTLFLLSAVITWEHATKRNSVYLYCLALVFWILGLFSKESAAVFPFIIVLRDLTKSTGKKSGKRLAFFQNRFYPYFSVFAVGIVWLSIRTSVLGGVFGPLGTPVMNPLAYVPTFERLLTAIKVMGLYTWNFLFPLHLSATYSFNEIPVVKSFMSPGLWFGLMHLILFALIISWFLQEEPIAGIGVSFFLINLLLVSNLFFVIGTIMANRLLYLPMSFAAISIGYLGERILIRTDILTRRLYLIAGVLVLGCLLLKTITRNPVWKNKLNFYKYTYQDAPHSITANYNFAEYIMKHTISERFLKKSLTLAENSLSLARRFPGPTPVDAYAIYAECLRRLAIKTDSKKRTKRLQKGLDALKEAEESVYEDFNRGYHYHNTGAKGRLLFHMLGRFYFRLGKFKKAEIAFNDAIRLKGQPIDYAYLGRVLTKLGKVKKGRRLINKALNQRSNPEWEAWLNSSAQQNGE